MKKEITKETIFGGTMQVKSIVCALLKLQTIFLSGVALIALATICASSIFGGAVGGLGVVAWAQDSQDGSAGIYGKMVKKNISRSVKANAANDTDSTDEDSNMDYSFANRQGENGEDLPNPSDISRPEDQQPFIFTDPRSAYTDSLADPTSAEVATDSLANPNTIFNTTLALSDPGVQKGHETAMMMAQFEALNRFQAMQQASNQFQWADAAGQQQAKSFYNCINKRMKEDTSGVNRRASWTKAYAQCSGEFYDANSFSGGMIPTGGAAEPSRIPAGGVTFKPADNPMYNDSYSPDPETVQLSDRIFGTDDQINNYASTVSINGRTVDPEKVRIAKEDFKAYVGDLVIKEDTTNQPNSGSGQSSPSMQYTVTEVKPSSGDVGERYQTKLKYTYKQFFKLLKERCKYSTQESEYDPFSGNNDYWGSSTLELELLQDLSIVGFQMKPALADSLYRLFMAKELKKEISASQCDERFKAESGSPYALESILINGSGNVGDQVPKEVRYVYKFARLITSGKMLQEFMAISKFIMSSSACSNQSKDCAYAIGLILKRADKTDLGVANAEIHKKIVDLLKEIQAAAASLSGSGVSLRGVYQNQNKSMPPSPWTSSSQKPNVSSGY